MPGTAAASIPRNQAVELTKQHYAKGLVRIIRSWAGNKLQNSSR